MGQCMHVRCYLNTRSGLLGLAIELNCQEYVGLCKMGSGGGELDVPGSLYAVSMQYVHIHTGFPRVRCESDMPASFECVWVSLN